MKSIKGVNVWKMLETPSVLPVLYLYFRNFSDTACEPQRVSLLSGCTQKALHDIWWINEWTTLANALPVSPMSPYRHSQAETQADIPALSCITFPGGMTGASWTLVTVPTKGFFCQQTPVFVQLLQLTGSAFWSLFSLEREVPSPERGTRRAWALEEKIPWPWGR